MKSFLLVENNFHYFTRRKRETLLVFFGYLKHIERKIRCAFWMAWKFYLRLLLMLKHCLFRISFDKELRKLLLKWVSAKMFWKTKESEKKNELSVFELQQKNDGQWESKKFFNLLAALFLCDYFRLSGKMTSLITF